MTYAADCRSELGGIEWLDDPARSARRTRASLFLFRTFSRQDQDRTVAMAPIRTQGVDQAKAVHARHVDVSNDHVGRIDLQPIKIGRAKVCNPVTYAHLVCRLMLQKKDIRYIKRI